MFSCKESEDHTIVWSMDSIEKDAGSLVTVLGDPRIVDEGGMEFDGIDDGLLVHKNPVSGMEEFTIEVEIHPYSGYPENREQRFLHLQDPENEDRRILIELRLNDREEWYGDWFIKSQEGSLALLDSTSTHPVNEWATIRLDYKDGKMTGYVNGEQEVTGNINYHPINDKGKTSLGTRMDKRSWYKGGIRKIRFIPKVSE